MRCPTLNNLPSPPASKTGWPWTEESPQLPDTMPDGRPWPKVSIVTPSYNQGRFLEETIRSVLLQGYPNLEYIIMDGGSTDNSVEIIKKYEPWLTYWESKPDRGQSHAINKGLKRATGEIFAWLNSDDRYLPNAVFTVIKAVNANPDAVAWVGGCRHETPEGREVSVVLPKGLDLPDFSRWWTKTFICQPSCFFKRGAFFDVGMLNEKLHLGMDFDLWLKLSKIGRFVGINYIISSVVLHEEAKTQKRELKLRMEAEDIAILMNHGYVSAAEERLERLTTVTFRKLLKMKVRNVLNLLLLDKRL